MAFELIPTLTVVAPKLLMEIGKWGMGKLQETSPVAEAMKTTEMAFPEIENLHTTLDSWCKSSKFSDLLHDLEMGKREFTDDAVVGNFKSSTDFYFGDDTEAVIKRLLATFFDNIQSELSATPEGLNIVANRQEVLFEETRTDLKKGHQLIHAQLAEIEKKISTNVLADDTEKRDASEAAFHARVDSARSLLQEGKAKAARSLLRPLRQEIIGMHPSKQLLFRIETNLGACALELDDLESAKEHLRSALEFDPKNPKALANAALAELIDGRLLEALPLVKKARALKPRDSHATSIYLQTLERLHRSEELDQLLESESWILDDLSCGIVLASIKLKQENFVEANALAKNCLALDKSNVVGFLILAQSIIRPIQQAYQEQHPLRWRVKPDRVDLLKEAERGLTRAIDLLVDYDNSSKLLEALTNRAIVRGLLSNFDGAINDCSRVLSIDPNEPSATHNKGLFLLDVGKATEAITYLEKSHNEDNDSVGKAIALADAYTNAGLPHKTVIILERHWESTHGARTKLHIADLLLNAYTELNKESSIAGLCKELKANFSLDPYAISVLARQERRENHFEEAIRLFNEAFAYTDANKDLIELELADLHYAKREFSKAAEYYSHIVDLEFNNSSLQKYLACLLNAGKLKDALSISTRLRAGGDAIPFVSEIEARIHAYIGAYDEAKKLYGQLSVIEPNKIDHLIEVAMLDILKGTPQDSVSVVNSIKIESLKNDAQALMRLAQIRFELGLTEVLSLAYRARRLAFNNPKIHLTYTGLLLQLEKKGHPIPQPVTVGIDCSVHLKDETGTKVFTIIDDDIVNIERGEILPSNVLAKALLGKSKGDTVVLKEGIEDLSYVISDIQSKFVRAFQQTLAEFTTWFPDNKEFFRLKLKDNDFTKVLSMIDHRHEWVSHAMQLYDSKQFTLGAFAEVIGKGLIDVWTGMVARTDGKVHAATGTAEDISKEGTLLSRCDSIAIELTSLLTLNSLNLLDRLPKRFSKVFVSQSTRDEVVNAIRNANAIQPSMTIWKEAGQYRRKEADPGALLRELEFLNRILNYVETSTEVVPITSALEMGKQEFEELAKLLGKSSLSSILAAKECHVPLYSDQLGLRQIANSDWEVEGVWSQSVLVSMRDRSLLTAEEYAEAVKKLVLANYYFISINAEILMSALKSSGMSLTQELIDLFTLLNGPSCSEESALTVLADLIKLVWLEPIPHHNKLLILDLVRSSLVTGRMAGRVIPRFKAQLHGRFFLMPQQFEGIVESIDLWQ